MTAGCNRKYNNGGADGGTHAVPHEALLEGIRRGYDLGLRFFYPRVVTRTLAMRLAGSKHRRRNGADRDREDLAGGRR